MNPNSWDQTVSEGEKHGARFEVYTRLLVCYATLFYHFFHIPMWEPLMILQWLSFLHRLALSYPTIRSTWEWRSYSDFKYFPAPRNIYLNQSKPRHQTSLLQIFVGFPGFVQNHATVQLRRATNPAILTFAVLRRKGQKLVGGHLRCLCQGDGSPHRDGDRFSGLNLIPSCKGIWVAGKRWC